MFTFLLATLKAQKGAWVSVHLHREALGYSLRRANSSAHDGKTSSGFQEESPGGDKETIPNTFSTEGISRHWQVAFRR